MRVKLRRGGNAQQSDADSRLVSDKGNVLFGAPAKGTGPACFSFGGLGGADDPLAYNRLVRLIVDGVRGSVLERRVGEPDGESRPIPVRDGSDLRSDS